MFPGGDVFVDRAAADDGFYAAVVVAVGARQHVDDVRVGLAVVAWQCAEAVKEAEVGGLGAVLLRNQVTHARALDQFLTLQHAAQQQADDDEHDCNFNQCKTVLLTHESSPPKARLKNPIAQCIWYWQWVMIAYAGCMEIRPFTLAVNTMKYKGG